MITPADYFLPHDSFRKHQLESILWLDSNTATRFLEAPPGSGKSAGAVALGKDKSVLILTAAKSLQDQYGDTYGVDLLKGRGNYPCVYETGSDCGECAFSEQGMRKCPAYSLCEYVMQRELVRSSDLACLNYWYWLFTYNKKWWEPDNLILDECHKLPDLVTDWAGCTLTQSDIEKWNLPEQPTITGYGGSILHKPKPANDKAKDWLYRCLVILRAEYKRLSKDAQKSKEARKKARRLEILGKKISAAVVALDVQEAWFIRSGAQALERAGNKEPGFIAKPLTAKQHFPRYFSDEHNLVLMSATIGNAEVFADALGIEDFFFRSVPNQYKPEERPVRVYKNAPSMGRASVAKNEFAYDWQADIIAKIIKDCPPDWSGAIHEMAKSRLKPLAEKLVSRGLEGRIWLPFYPNGAYMSGTDRQLASWAEFRERIPGAIAITCSWHEGVDLFDERINIIAKTPFEDRSTEFAKERIRADQKFSNLKTAWKLVQGCGRTRRSESDYDINGKVNGVVAIVDSSWKRVQKYLSDDWRDAIVEM